jgi:uncharacterized protein (TIGR00290 family)
VTELRGQRFFCSWSGGKDACLALFRAVREGGSPAALLTTLNEDGLSSRGHGMELGLLRAQAESLGIKLITRPTSWEGYREEFLAAARALAAEGVGVGVFGDIELREHRDWIEDVSSDAGIEPCFPLWGCERSELVGQFIEEGFKATITSVKDGVLPAELLGEELSPETLLAIEKAGADLCGEDGEYHTVVTGGPIFKRPLELLTGGRYEREGYTVLEVRCRT